MIFQVQALASQLSDLWNLMDAPMEERQPFHHVTRNLSLALDEVMLPGALAFDVLQQVSFVAMLHGLANVVLLAASYLLFLHFEVRT